MFNGRERMRHLRQEALVARVDDHADAELVDRGRREGFPGGKTLVQNSISRTRRLPGFPTRLMRFRLRL
jgi:hypothetical protein